MKCSWKQQYEKRILWRKGMKQKKVLWKCWGWLKICREKEDLNKERGGARWDRGPRRDSWTWFTQRLAKSNEKTNICRAAGETEPLSQLWMFEPGVLTSQACIFLMIKLLSTLHNCSWLCILFGAIAVETFYGYFPNQTRPKAANEALEEWARSLIHLGTF